MKKFILFAIVGLGAALLPEAPARAHGPLFSPAPETIFRGGTELTLGLHTEKAAQKATGAQSRDYGVSVEAEYGITANWQIGIELPYVRRKSGGLGRADGLGDITLDSKYQFWKRDIPGAQYKATALVRLKLPTGSDKGAAPLGGGQAEVTMGLVTGYESRRWHWFASGVYQVSAGGAADLEKGDRQSLNLVGGIRPVLSAYSKPDTVLMLELNWGRSGRDSLGGAPLVNTGGWEMFLSPVVWWTYRQLAIRGGIQIPLANGLNGVQLSPRTRGRLEFVYHF